MKSNTTPVMYPDNPKQRNVRIEIGEEARSYITGQQRVTMVPLTIRRKQNRKVMTPPPGERSVLGAGGEDIPMIRTLGKAFYWQKLLDQGKYATIRDLALSMKLEQGWVAEVLRMTTLILSHAPITARARNDRANERDRPKTIVARPNPATARSRVRPARRNAGR